MKQLNNLFVSGKNIFYNFLWQVYRKHIKCIFVYGKTFLRRCKDIESIFSKKKKKKDIESILIAQFDQLAGSWARDQVEN